MAAPARGKVVIDNDECKGCGLCVESCPPKCLELLESLNAYGIHPAHCTGENCTGCGICFYCCPEPGAIVVYRVSAPAKAAVSSSSACSSGVAGGEHAATL